MIVKIAHTWYKGKEYDMTNQYDVIEFLHDMRTVTQFATRSEIRLVKGDAGDT
jgi:hypothetical protein